MPLRRYTCTEAPSPNVRHHSSASKLVGKLGSPVLSPRQEGRVLLTNLLGFITTDMLNWRAAVERERTVSNQTIAHTSFVISASRLLLRFTLLGKHSLSCISKTRFS